MNGMLICNYAMVRFAPDRETGEFVNVGVVLYCREAGFFAARLELQRQKRVADFFPESDARVFEEAQRFLQAECERVKVLLCDPRAGLDDAARLGVFRELVKPRESLLRFGEIGTAMAADPAKLIETLFERYVNRSAARRLTSAPLVN